MTPKTGTRIRYTGDRANASGDGYVVMADTSTGAVDVALDDGRYWPAVRHFDDGAGCRFLTLPNEPIAHPLECVRRVNDHLAKRKHQKEQRDGAEAVRLAKIAKGAEAIVKPAGNAKAVIVAEYMEDDSDSQSDYYASHASKLVVLAFSKHARDLFPEMRAAVARFAPAAHLAIEGEEHREKWSMGHGYYLAGKGGKYSGWVVRKLRKYGDRWDDKVLEAMGCDMAEHVAKWRDEPTAKPEPINCDSGIR